MYIKSVHSPTFYRPCLDGNPTFANSNTCAYDSVQ